MLFCTYLLYKQGFGKRFCSFFYYGYLNLSGLQRESLPGNDLYYASVGTAVVTAGVLRDIKDSKDFKD
jgi:hypothetical protein